MVTATDTIVSAQVHTMDQVMDIKKEQGILAYHQSKINIDISKFCRLYEESEETFIHLVSHCPRLTETREDIFQDKVFGYDHTWAIRRLMEFIHLPVITRMLTSKQGLVLVWFGFYFRYT